MWENPKKWKLNFQLLSSLKPKNEDLEACYGFLSVGTYKATPNSIEKNQPRHTKLAQPWAFRFGEKKPLFFCELVLGKKSAAKVKKLSIRDQEGYEMFWCHEQG